MKTVHFDDGRIQNIFIITFTKTDVLTEGLE